MLLFTLQFFVAMFSLGFIVAIVDEYVFKHKHGINFRLLQATLFSAMLTCLIPINIAILSYIN